MKKLRAGMRVVVREGMQRHKGFIEKRLPATMSKNTYLVRTVEGKQIYAHRCQIKFKRRWYIARFSKPSLRPEGMSLPYESVSTLKKSIKSEDVAEIVEVKELRSIPYKIPERPAFLNPETKKNGN